MHCRVDGNRAVVLHGTLKLPKIDCPNIQELRLLVGRKVENKELVDAQQNGDVCK